MSLTATASTTSQALAEWGRIFPKQVTETYMSSVTFMKQLTIVAVSTISYLKNVFPEQSYTSESFAGVKLKILKDTCKDELAQFVSSALAQAFEAFEKKYLHKLALCFYDGDCHIDNLIEYHVFEYTYAPEGVTMGVTSKSRDITHSSQYSFDNIQAKTVQLIRTCIVVMQSSHNQVPLSYDISLRLYYNDGYYKSPTTLVKYRGLLPINYSRLKHFTHGSYNVDAPEGYQAPGYLSTTESRDHLDEAPGVVLRLGVVATPYHRFVGSSCVRENLVSIEAQASQNAPMMTQNEGDDFNNGEVASTRSDTESSGPRVSCLCGQREPGGDLMLACDYCGTLQHAACYGRLSAVVKHCCTQCSDVDPTLTPTDLRIAQLSPMKRESLSLLRRTLVWCGGRRAAGAGALQQQFALSRACAAKLLRLLHSHGVVEDVRADIMAPRKIKKEQLDSAMNKYFHTEELDLVQRLVAETLSQDGRPDPVGDLLSPTEKASLQNATALGNITEPTPRDSVMEDATLKQYKEVNISNEQTEELPLSGNHNPVNVMEIGKKGKRKADKENVRAGVMTKRSKTRQK